LESLSIPLASLLSASFVQPTFSANYLAIDIKPSPGGGLSEGTTAEIRLKDQGMFGFVSTLDKMRERALFMKRESALEDQLRKDILSLE
jgi:WW domain-binding protein 2